ncbi:multiple sugar transport system permease protein [Arthrobacter pigmenti]|uniref:Multiple sugar transport system permease protein n=1 Tax=Arthrobacter pigmenti TaxID=271432 RepID=A0A846RM42_9MICC|nr:sugar ABC transporter permease [Arthrobacter pigmenti]NJC22690.1 multiple sugar transport system permease protein [Arthrobacter pigmenti]
MSTNMASVSAPPERPIKRRKTRKSGGRDAWILVLPTLLPVVLFSIYPLAQGVLLGFTDARAGLNVEPTFNGLENYQELFGYDLFWESFQIGLIWAFSVTILQFFASLGLALLLNMDLRLRWLARTLVLIPWAIPPVIVAIMWRLMLDPSFGPVNQALGAVGLPDNINWLGDFSTALPAVIVVGVWSGMPQTTITLLAGIQSVQAELHEAAAIDGAGSWGRFIHVTLPALKPIIIAITTLDLIWNFNSFALVFVLTAGGPGGQTMLPMLFAYNEAFRYGEFGLASAMGNVMVVVIAIFLVVYLRAQTRERK